MTTKDALRQQALRLVKMGITQKTIAAKMGISEPKVTRWLQNERVRIDTDEMDGLRRYLAELKAMLDEETQRDDASAGHRFSETQPRPRPTNKTSHKTS